MTSASNQIVGYVTPRPFGQFSMPVPAQNSCLREYAKNHGFDYALPQCEHIFDGCFVQLFGTLNECETGGHVVMYSSLMLPERSLDMNKLKSILEEKEITIHTVLEKSRMSVASDFANDEASNFLLEIINRNSLGDLQRYLPDNARKLKCTQQ